MESSALVEIRQFTKTKMKAFAYTSKEEKKKIFFFSTSHQQAMSGHFQRSWAVAHIMTAPEGKHCK